MRPSSILQNWQQHAQNGTQTSNSSYNANITSNSNSSSAKRSKARWKDVDLAETDDTELFRTDHAKKLLSSPLLKPTTSGPQENDALKTKNAELLQAQDLMTRRCRTLEAQKKSLEKSDKKLKEQIVSLSVQVAKLTGAKEKFRDVQAVLTQQESLANKLTRERDRLKEKNKGLMAKVNALGDVAKELKTVLGKSAELQEQLDTLNGNNIAKAKPGDLEFLLKFYSDGISRVHTAMTQSIDKERKALAERRMCKICYDKEVSCLLLPCCHYITCEPCAKGITRCPVCRRPITERKPVYT
jgi:chromosome segregation ATPase